MAYQNVGKLLKDKEPVEMLNHFYDLLNIRPDVNLDRSVIRIDENRSIAALTYVQLIEIKMMLKHIKALEDHHRALTGLHDDLTTLHADIIIVDDSVKHFSKEVDNSLNRLSSDVNRVEDNVKRFDKRSSKLSRIMIYLVFAQLVLAAIISIDKFFL